MASGLVTTAEPPNEAAQSEDCRPLLQLRLRQAQIGNMPNASP